MLYVPNHRYLSLATTTFISLTHAENIAYYRKQSFCLFRLKSQDLNGHNISYAESIFVFVVFFYEMTEEKPKARFDQLRFLLNNDLKHILTIPSSLWGNPTEKRNCVAVWAFRLMDLSVLLKVVHAKKNSWPTIITDSDTNLVISYKQSSVKCWLLFSF